MFLGGLAILVSVVVAAVFGRSKGSRYGQQANRQDESSHVSLQTWKQQSKCQNSGVFQASIVGLALKLQGVTGDTAFNPPVHAYLVARISRSFQESI